MSGPRREEYLARVPTVGQGCAIGTAITAWRKTKEAGAPNRGISQSPLRRWPSTPSKDMSCVSHGVKGGRPGRSTVAVLPKGDTSDPLGGFSYSPGIDAVYSLSSLKTICAW